MKLKGLVESRLATYVKGAKPRSVYEPIRYILNGGGKRVRAVLVLLSCEAVGGKAQQALDAAAAIEILHNFTLVHDDVMDNAPVRRGKPTVHNKWDTNVAILSGDEMIALAYRCLLNIRNPYRHRVMQIFTDAFIQVCEGQGLDKEFESRRNVSMEEYFLMIRKKTGRMIAAATEIGALAGGGTHKHIELFRKFGDHVGRAFQLQDDLLDIAGNPLKFGKAIGGDIVEGKKTFLLLKALERARGSDRAVLYSVAQGNGASKAFVNRVQNIYLEQGILEETRLEISRSTREAQRMLEQLPPGQAKRTLLWLSEKLLERNS